PTISYDPGGEAFRDPAGVAEATRHVDFLLLNSNELKAITGGVGYEHASRLIGGRVKLVVVKAGVEGAYAVGDNGVVYMANPPPRVRVVDVTGAGDSFNAAFLVWLKSGRSIGESLRAGVAAGTAKVARMGSSNMPSLAEVVELLGSTPPCRVLRA
ncbi:MAG: carbohydrate kinase family protein, partial [Desulfurococcales archaeon]|nr:carbohydrate kinase family protein [Desulfurococcales archaeon]